MIGLAKIKYIVIVLGLLLSLGPLSYAQENDNGGAPVRFQTITFDISPKAANATLIQDRDGFFG